MVLLLAHFLMRECGLAVQKGREEEPDLPRFAEYRGSWLTVSQILSTVWVWVEGGFVVRHRGWVREEIIDDNIFTERKNDIFKSQTIFWYS